MLILWSATITVGLLVLVYLMVAGVPHAPVMPGNGEASVGPPRTLLPVLGAFSTGLGIAGYLTMNRPGLSGPWRVAVIVAAALLTSIVTRWVVIRAFTEPPPDPEDDPRYRYQGHVGRVTEPIAVDRAGRIVFEADGRRFDLAARSVDDQPVDRDVEIVIERIDDEVATVERWAVVEQRL